MAHAETPRLRRRVSDSRPIQRADAPVETITASARTSSSSDHIVNGRFENSTRVMFFDSTRVPNRTACFLKSSIIVEPVTPSG